MTGEHDYDSAATNVHTAYHVPPINAHRVLALGLDGSNAVAIKVASDGTVATSGASFSLNSEHREDLPFFDGDTGIFALGVRNDGPSVTTDADGDYSQISLDERGRVYITLGQQTVTISGDITVLSFPVSSTAVTSVSGNASSVTLLSANAGRRGASFHNDSTAIAYLKCGTTASTSSFTIKMQPDSHYELTGGGVYCYQGVVDCIWASATGAMRITEYF